jgi:hypothetical protein
MIANDMLLQISNIQRLLPLTPTTLSSPTLNFHRIYNANPNKAITPTKSAPVPYSRPRITAASAALFDALGVEPDELVLVAPPDEAEDVELA